MSTPVAHTLAGIASLALAHSVRPQSRLGFGPGPMLLAAFAGCAPDLDILVSLLFTGTPNLLHSGATHSFAFALLGGAITFLLLRDSDLRFDIALVVTLGLLSHVLVDGVTGPQPGRHPTWGLMFFWPFDRERYQLPVTLFRGVKHGDLSVWFSFRNLQTALIELVTFSPVTFFAIWASRRRRELHGA